MADKSLREYERKRDFTRTAEPPPKKAPSDGEKRLFVIQKHDASRLHYDFRLELDGTLNRGRCPRECHTRKATSGSRCTWKITRSTMRASKGNSEGTIWRRDGDGVGHWRVGAAGRKARA
jgi:DNA ligase D-like protein (predicted 3'-phosphoesterase)